MRLKRMKTGKRILPRNGMKLVMMQQLIMLPITKMLIMETEDQMMKLKAWVILLSRVLKLAFPRVA
jgi:hypothetical protein